MDRFHLSRPESTPGLFTVSWSFQLAVHQQQHSTQQLVRQPLKPASTHYANTKISFWKLWQEDQGRMNTNVSQKRRHASRTSTTKRSHSSCAMSSEKAIATNQSKGGRRRILSTKQCEANLQIGEGGTLMTAPRVAVFAVASTTKLVIGTKPDTIWPCKQENSKYHKNKQKCSESRSIS